MSARSIPAAVFVLALASSALAAADTLTDTAARVRADHAALDSAQADFHSERDAGRLSAAEQADYQRYITSLAERLRDDCRDYGLAGGDPASLHGLCDIATPAAPRAAAIDTAAERTQQERMSDADAELRASMGDFDESLLQEQARIRAKQDASGGGGGGSGSGSGANGSTGQAGGSQAAKDGQGDAGEAKTGKDVTETAQGTPGSATNGDSGNTAQGTAKGQGQSQGGPGTGKAAGKAGRTPGDIPSGRDDDVIARQLREAAENEPDPELRAKLWDEYRRYKDEQK